MTKNDDKYSELVKWKNKKNAELQDAIDHKDDSEEDKERYEKLSKEYDAIKKAFHNGAKSIDEIKKIVGPDMISDVSKPDTPQPTKKEDPPKTEEQSPMFSARIELLIKSAFKDGVLTQKEKDTILRRAEKEGEDLDEFEMLLNERIEEMGIKVIEDNSEDSPQKSEIAFSDSFTPQTPQESELSTLNDVTPPTPPKGKGIFSEKLLFLIDNALEDGELTDQEKNAIIKRAQDEGEDINEVDIYIQSLQQKRQKELQEKVQKTAAKEMEARRKAQEAKAKADQEEEKERATILRKCPKCGEFIPEMTNICPTCGHILDKTKTDSKMALLIKLLRDYENGDKFNATLFCVEIWDVDMIVNKEEYELCKNLFEIRETKENGCVKVESTYSRIMAEATLYRDNPVINSLMTKIEKKLKDKKRNRLGCLGIIFIPVIISFLKACFFN